MKYTFHHILLHIVELIVVRDSYEGFCEKCSDNELRKRCYYHVARIPISLQTQYNYSVLPHI